MADGQVDGTIGWVPNKRPSISDVALAAGVSRAAVSKVIRDAYGVSPAMRLRVEAAIEQLQYRPRTGARALRGSSFTIGFEVPHLGNDFFNQVVEGAATSLASSKYQLIVAPGLSYLSGRSVLDTLVDRQVDGIIAIASAVEADWLDRLAAEVPMVLLGRHDSARRYDTVTGDDVAGTDLVMDHLLGLGHRRISHLTLRPPTPRSPHALRLHTYLSRMQQAECEPRVAYTETEQDAYQAAATLLAANDPPTAVFAGHDALAIAVLRAVADADKTAAVSVVGYDNIELAQHPLISLTTVDQFGPEMGSAAIDLLMKRIQGGRTTSEHVEIDPQLRIRKSSRPWPS